MLSRRSLFKRLAVVALAPEIAFASKLEIRPPLDLQELFGNVYELARARMHQPQIDIFTDKAGLDALYAMTGQSAPESVFTEPLNLKAFSGEPVGIYAQLRQAGGCRG